jgi:hypothetical protein
VRALRHTRLLWFLGAAEFALMTAMELLLFRRLSGGLASLDVRPCFSAPEVSQWLTALGPQGAETILVWHYLTFDLVFPVLFGLALASSILLLGRRLSRFAAMPHWLQLMATAVLVLPYVGFDYAQNWAVAQLLRQPLSVDPLAVSRASGLNLAKLVFGAIPLLAIALFALAGQKGRQGTSQPGEQP